jgi:hypothetical protein
VIIVRRPIRNRLRDATRDDYSVGSISAELRENNERNYGAILFFRSFIRVVCVCVCVRPAAAAEPRCGGRHWRGRSAVASPLRLVQPATAAAGPAAARGPRRCQSPPRSRTLTLVQ